MATLVQVVSRFDKGTSHMSKKRSTHFEVRITLSIGWWHFCFDEVQFLVGDERHCGWKRIGG